MQVDLNMRNMRLSALWALLLALACAACTPPGPAPKAWRAEATQARPLSAPVRWVATSLDFPRATKAAYEEGEQRIAQAARRYPTGEWAVVMDLDQTVLNNIEYQKALDARGAAFSPETWRAWVEERQATLIPGAHDFIRHVHARGGQVLFVTNRRDYELAATEDNLRALDLRRGEDYALLLPRAWPDGEDSKERRFAALPGLLTASGHPATIIAYVGDTVGDRPQERGEALFVCIPQGHLYGHPCEDEARH